MKTFIKIITLLSLIIIISSCIKEDIKELKDEVPDMEEYQIVKIHADDGKNKQTQGTPKK